jgi:hypothetical protein
MDEGMNVFQKRQKTQGKLKSLIVLDVEGYLAISH